MSVFTLSPSWHDRGARVLQQVAGSPAVLGLGLCLGLEAAVLAHFKRMLHGYRLEPKRKQGVRKEERKQRDAKKGEGGGDEKKGNGRDRKIGFSWHPTARQGAQGQKGDTAPMLLHVEHCRHRTHTHPRHPPLPTHLLLPLSPILVTNHIPELLMN